MKLKWTYYRDAYGCTASIRENRDLSATLCVCDAHGRPFYGKCYGSKTAAKRALGRLGDCWRECPPTRKT
jgi:hypothetical protein